MKKAAAVLFLILTSNIFAYFIGGLFQRGKLDIVLTPTNNMTQFESDIYDYLFVENSGKYEIGLFCYVADTNAPEYIMKNIEMEYDITSTDVLSYLLNDSCILKNMNVNNSKTIKADKSMSTLINFNGNPSEYINHNFVLFNKYYNKKQKGFVIEVIMFDDAHLVDTKQFKKDIQVFRFR